MQEKTEESKPESQPHPPRFNKLTRTTSDSVSESYVKSLRNLPDYIYEINYSKESQLQKIDTQFSSNSKLYSVTFPPSLTTIEPNSMNGLQYLYEILFLKNDDGESYLETIGCNALCGTNLESIIIPSNIINIESKCFPECIKSIELEKGAPKLQKLGDFIFSKTQIETFKMPINISPLLNSKQAFYQCQKLSKIIFDSYINKKELPEIDYDSEENEITQIKKRKQEFKEKGQNLIVLDNFGEPLECEEDEEEESLIEGVTLDKAKHLTLSQIPNLKTIEIFSTNLNDFYFFNTPNLTSIQIPKGEKSRYIKQKGLLYTKDKKRLIVAERNVKNATISANCELISNYALNVKSLEKVVFENNSQLQEISMFAFAESNIKEVLIPDSVDLINYGAFYKCKKLETVNIPISLSVIDIATFSYTKLTKIKIPSNIKYIQTGSFFKCSQLSEVEFESDSKLTKIGDYAFAETKIETITIPKSVKSIGDFCFINCKKLKKFLFEDQSCLSRIGKECFKGTKVDEFQLPKEIQSFDFSKTKVKNVTFSDNYSHIFINNFHHSLITQICIPSSVVEIEKHAFLECIKLAKVTFSDVSKSNLQKISKEAFFNCSSLTEFEMPKTVKYFGINSFRNCSKLTSQVVIENNDITVCENAFDNTGILTFQSKGQNISINDFAFNNCPNLTQFSAEATKSCILGSSLFTNCTSLADVKLNFKSETVKIGQFCFSNSPIKAFEIPKHLKIIPKSCFQNCANLAQVTVNKGLDIEIFGCEAFAGSGIESIIIPPNTKVIDEKCFKDCLQLKKLSFAKDLIECSIKEKAFYNAGIQQLSIPKTVIDIDKSCFKNCQDLTKLAFSSEIKIQRIKIHAFQSTGMKSLVIPSSIKIVEKSAFRDCKQLQSVTFEHEDVKVSGASFTGCDKLKSIKCNNHIVIEALNTPDVFYQQPIYVNLSQDQINQAVIKLLLIDLKPLYQHFQQQFDFANSLVFNSSEFQLNSPIDCYFNNNLDNETKYQIIEYKDGGYYSNLMEKLVFCDFSRKEMIVSKDTKIIESNAFKYSNLKRIEFEDNSLLKEIKSFAFEFLRIEEIEIPDTVTYIGNYAFSDCYSLNKVIINQTSNLENIGEYAFAKTAIKSILFPEKLRNIGNFAFFECYMLTQVENYSNEIKFGYGSFYCSSIEKINFPEKSVFEDFSFSNCKRLKKLSFVDNKEKIVFGEDSFSFSGLEEILIKCDAEIKAKAFSNCSNLKKLTLDGNIKCSKRSFADSNLEDCTINLTQSIHKKPTLQFEDIIISNIDKCSIKLNTSENFDFNMNQKCYVLNNTLEYADLIDNFSLTTPYHCESTRKPIKKNEILRIPNGVTKLDFQMMSHIKMIIFPSDCQIDDLGPSYSFSYHNLIEITIPKLVQRIPDHCFEHCHFLRNVKFEKGSVLKEIGKFGFSNTRIRKAILPNSVQIIQNSAFSNNHDLKEVSFDGEIIEDEAFSQTGLKSFVLSNNTKKIGSKAFQYCNKLASFSIDIENSNLSEIGSCAFLRTAISSINIPANVKTIESFTFEDCGFLKELNVSMNSQLEKVNKFAFSGSTRLIKMTIPRSISKLFDKFIGEPSLHSILHETNQKYCLIESKENQEKCNIMYNFSEENTQNSLINNCYVIDNELVYADLIDNSGLFEPMSQEELDLLMKRNEFLVVPNNVKKLNFPIMPHVKRIYWSTASIVDDIGPSGFFSYYNLNQITIPKSVQIIPPRAFEHCHYLSVLLFESKSKLKEIGEFSFSNTKIKKVVLPNSVKIICKGAFSNNLELNEVTFNGEIIDDEAFSHTGITSFILSNKTKSIGSKAFEYCKSLQTFSINLDYSSLSEIGSYAFSETPITTINIPPNVKTIKSFTFSGCRSLKTVNISNESRLEEINEYSFAENLSLLMINIPKSIRKLSYEAFINTPSLQSIMNDSNDDFTVLDDHSVYGSDRTLVFVPRFLKKFKVIENCLIIHSGAFCGPNLEEVTFMDDSLMCIDKCAFAHSSALKMINIPKSIQFIGEEAFIHCENLNFVQFDQESKILEIPKFCFAFSGLKGIILPKSLEFINQSSFFYCKKLLCIALENTNVKYIGDYAFSITDIEEVKLPSTIQFIGSHAFEANKSLKEIDLTRISNIEETNPNQIKQFGRMLYKSQKKILKLISDRIQQNYLTEDEINEHNEVIRNELPQVIVDPNPPPEEDTKTNKSPRRKAKFNGPNIQIKSSPYLMLKDVPKVFKPNPYINKKVSIINHPPFDNRAPVPSAPFGKKKSAFPAPPPLPQLKKGEKSPRRLNRNRQNNNVEYQSILQPETNEEEYSQDFTESTENSVSNEINNTKQVEPKSPKCYIDKTAFSNSTIKTIRCNFEEPKWFSFFENCKKIGKLVINSDIRFRLKKLGIENNDGLLAGSLFRIVKLQYLNRETLPLLSNQLLTDFMVSKSVKFLNPYTFSHCSKLTKVSFDNEVEIKMIPEFCFAYSSLKEISIPATVQSINKCAFLSCTGLERVNFTRGNNLQIIGKGAFCECSSLSSIHISKSVNKIGKFAFYSCTNLQKVSFSDGSKLKIIDEGAFSKCSKLSSIKLPNKMNVIGKECFSYSGLKSIQIPQLVKKINAKTFYHCEELSKISLNEGLVEVGESSFAYNKSMKIINIPDSVEIIKSYAFEENRKLKKVKISSNTQLVEIQEGSFEYTEIDELKVNYKARQLFNPTHVNKLNKITFEGGTPTFFIQTEDGTIYEKTDKFGDKFEEPANIDDLESELYLNLTNDFIKSMYYYSDKYNKYTLNKSNRYFDRNRANKDREQISSKILVERNRFSPGVDKNRPLLNLVFAPKNSECLTIHEDCFSINDSVLDGMNNLTTIEYKKGITNMINGFGNFNHLTSNVMNKITEINIKGQYCHLCEGVFTNIETLERVEISPETNLTYIPKRAFEGCTNLREIIIPNTCFSIEERSFKNCVNLEVFFIGDPEDYEEEDSNSNEQKKSNLRFIRKEAFYNCSSLTSFTLPASVYAICESAFMNCTNLDTFEIDDDDNENYELEIIEKNSFKNCKVLSSFHLPLSCKYVGPGAFMNCLSMKTFEYEGSELQSIQSRTFYNCRSLNRIEFLNLSYDNNYIPSPDFDSDNEDNNEEESQKEEHSEEEQKYGEEESKNEEKSKQEHSEEESKKEEHNEEENKKEESTEENEKKEEQNEEESKKEENNEENEKKEDHNEEEQKHDDEESKKEEQSHEEHNEEESKKEEHNEEEQKYEEYEKYYFDERSESIKSRNQKYKKLSKSSFFIGTEAFKNCISLTEVVFEDESKFISTIQFHSNDMPVFVRPPHIASKIHDINEPYCVTKRQTIQKSAFSNCRSLSYVRFFLGNLECIQPRAFENCISLNNIEINSQFWRFLLTESLDFSSFAGTPENLSIKMFSNNEYACLLVDLSNHPKNPNHLINHQPSSMAKSLPKNAVLSKSRTNFKNKTFEIPKEQQIQKPILANEQIKEFLFMDNIHMYLSKTEKENVRDLNLCFSDLKLRNSRWDVFESIPFLRSQPLCSITEMTSLVHAINFPSFYELTEINFGNDMEIDMIPDFCFSYTALKAISIPSSVEKIGKYAFYSCTDLQNVSFYEGSKLKIIDESAFSRCSNLSSIYLPYQLEDIGKECFSYSGLKSIQIPQLVKKINAKTFYHCEELSKISLNEGLVEVGESSFAYNKSMKIINIPDSVEIIKSYAFEENRKLKKVKISSNTQLIEIQEGSFEYTEIDELKVNYKARQLFNPTHVNKLNKITFEGGTPTFFIQAKDGTIYEKTDKFDILLENVSDESDPVSPNLIYKIIMNDYYGLNESHEDYAKKSEEIILRRNRLRFSNGDDSKKPLLNLVFAPKDSKTLKIQQDCFSINDSVLDGMNNLTTIEYKKGITNMINGFGNFNHLTSNVMNKITEINIKGQYCHLCEGVFSNIETLERVEISPETNLTYIPKRAFEGCTNLREIIIPNTCFSIEEQSFKNCVNLRSFMFRTKDKNFNQIKPNLRFIRKEAFYNCSSLTSFTLPASVYAICESAFMNCTNLDTFEIDDDDNENYELEIIEKNSFKNCKVLSSFHLPLSCKYVGPGAFMNCLSMKTFEYEGSELQSIQSRTFYNCKSLTIFKMKNLFYKTNYYPSKKKNDDDVDDDNEPQEIENVPQFSIGQQAFMNCTSLKKVIFEDKSKTMKTFEFGINNSPRLLNPDHNYVNCRHNMIPRRQTIKRKAFCNCKSLVFARFFFGNLERFEANCFKNCSLLNSIDLNSQYSHFLLNESFDENAFEGVQDDVEFKIYNMNTYIKSFFSLSLINEQQMKQKQKQENENENKDNNLVSTESRNKFVSHIRLFKEYLSSLDKTKKRVIDDENSSVEKLRTSFRLFEKYLSSLEKTKVLFQFDSNESKRRHRKKKRQNKQENPQISYNDLIWQVTSALPEWIDQIVILNPVSQIRIFKKWVSSFDSTYHMIFLSNSFLDDNINYPKMRHFKHHLLTTSELMQLKESSCLIENNVSNGYSGEEEDDDGDENYKVSNDVKSKTI